MITSFLSGFFFLKTTTLETCDLTAIWLAFTKIVLVFSYFHSPSFCRKELFKLILSHIGGGDVRPESNMAGFYEDRVGFFVFSQSFIL